MLAAHPTVLLVERDPSIEQALERALQREGLDSIWARTSEDAEAALATRRPCLVILNPRLPPEDGWQVYRKLRRHAVPIMLVAPGRDPTLERMALTLGADDCVAGDAPAADIATRARFLLQRGGPAPPAALACGDLTLDLTTGQASVDHRNVALTRSEAAVLATLLEAQGGVVSREQLVLRARAQAGALPLARSVESHVRSLRSKLEADPARPTRILSVRGFGYRLAASAAPPRARLVEAAFEALPDPVLVVDAQQRVEVMNRAAEALVGQTADAVVGKLSCSALLGCQLGPDRACPGLEALFGSGARSAEIAICPIGTTVHVEETASPLPGDPGHLLLLLRERARD